MAEFDKNLVMGMLQSLLGEENKEHLSSQNPIVESSHSPESSASSASSEQPVPLPVSPHEKDVDDFINTAEMMSRFTDIIGRFRQANHTKEAALLSALRPYLRASRQPKVDTMLRALQAYRVFSEMKKSNS